MVMFAFCNESAGSSSADALAGVLYSAPSCLLLVGSGSSHVRSTLTPGRQVMAQLWAPPKCIAAMSNLNSIVRARKSIENRMTFVFVLVIPKRPLGIKWGRSLGSRYTVPYCTTTISTD